MSVHTSYVRAELIKALLALLQIRNLKQITVSELCRQAGVSRLSFYRNYTSMEEILREHLQKITDEFLKNHSVNFRTTPREEFISLLFAHLSVHKELIALLAANNLTFLLKDEFDSAFMRSAGANADPYKCCVASGAYFNLFSYWFQHGCKESPAEVSKMLDGFLV
ncbi:MAG: TetR/AcrR family transcriptional regulator [Bulleidia sp.]